MKKILVNLSLFGFFLFPSCEAPVVKNIEPASSVIGIDFPDSPAESLKTLIGWTRSQKSYSSDTTRINALNNLGYDIMYSDPDTAILLSDEALQLAQTILWEKGMANSLSNLGIYNWIKADYQKALDYHLKALELDQKNAHKRGIARSFINIGLVYWNQSNYPKALEYYLNALRIAEEIKNEKMIGNIYSNLGSVYVNTGDLKKAEEYYKKALLLAENAGNKNNISIISGNMGNLYADQKEYQKALDYYLRALQIAEELNDRNKITMQFGNIGVVYKELGDKADEKIKKKEYYDLALQYYQKALKIREELGAKNLIATSLGSIGALYSQTGNYAEAEKYLLEALAINKELGVKDQERQFEELITELYEKTGRYQQALQHHKHAADLKDSIFNEEKENEITRRELNYEFEKREVKANAEHEKEMAVKAQDNKRQKLVIIAVCLILVVTSFFLYRTNQQRMVIAKQKKQVELQKSIVEEKNKEITDSITYAKRIQEAIMPSLEQWKKTIPDSFIVYLPKDIVAGDFYWQEETENHLYIAAADCTGHGVPGAMVSVVCSNALTKAVLEEKIRDTGKILDRVRAIVIEKLGKNKSDTVKDGMDICLIRINKLNRKEIQFSGANRPLWKIGTNGLTEFKPDKQPIGEYHVQQDFTKTDLTMMQGEMLYLFTDGYQDQFGGDNSKKMGGKAWKTLLVSIYAEPLTQQQRLITDHFTTWKGVNDQIDDVTVIGLRF